MDARSRACGVMGRHWGRCSGSVDLLASGVSFKGAHFSGSGLWDGRSCFVLQLEVACFSWGGGCRYFASCRAMVSMSWRVGFLQGGITQRVNMGFSIGCVGVKSTVVCWQRRVYSSE